MSPWCLCGPRLSTKPPRLKVKSVKSVKSVELHRLPTLPREIWVSILNLLPLHLLWRNARPTCRAWNAEVLDIVWKAFVLPTVIDVQWRSREKPIRQRLYPSIPKSVPETKPFSTVVRWVLPAFEKSLNTSERYRYHCQNVIILLPSGRAWQNVASFVQAKNTTRTDVWEFEQLATGGAGGDLFSEEFYVPQQSWLAWWRVVFKKTEESSTSERGGIMCLDHVTVPLAQFVKVIALAEDEEWPFLAKIDGFDRKTRTRPNSAIGTSTPRRRSEPAIMGIQ